MGANFLEITNFCKGMFPDEVIPSFSAFFPPALAPTKQNTRAGKRAAIWRQARGSARKDLGGPNFLFLLVCACLRLHPSLVKQRRRRAAAEMEIRVRCGCGDSSCPEWAVVELQGVVQPQASFSGDIRGLHIGRLCSAPSPSSSKGGYTFTVGYHELAGTKVTLKKPLLVLRKKKVGGGAPDQEPPMAAEVELEVIGVIRHKILFKDRPKALISTAEQGEEGRAASSKLTPILGTASSSLMQPCRRFRGPCSSHVQAKFDAVFCVVG
ncbi:uncharacterized protein LOC120697317 isoform X2 [Panicum virgatum]|uniref:uncharacterized protein LOC120697317 isoform X2 n=1 Tax=Panicum virgatum TaxID=38727 RepID=UPI0019D5565D|nr:uncharacterized protein LOC120697317 isoform X2 [Panicum virgatum]